MSDKAIILLVARDDKDMKEIVSCFNRCEKMLSATMKLCDVLASQEEGNPNRVEIDNALLLFAETVFDTYQWGPTQMRQDIESLKTAQAKKEGH